MSISAGTSSSKADRARRIAKNLSNHYDGLVDRYIEVFFNDKTDAPWLELFLAALPAGSHVLDVGCGPGNFARYIIQEGYRVTGIDISKGMIDAARELVPNASFDVMDMSHLRYRANTFDGLLAAYSFLHVPASAAEHTLMGFRRVVVPGGVVCLMVKRGQGEQTLPSPLVAGKTCYVQLWRDKDLLSVLQKCSFEIIDQQSAPPVFSEELRFEKTFFLTRVSKPRRKSK